jgi:putative ABC transport system permease protein
VSTAWGLPPRIDAECEVRPAGKDADAALSWKIMYADASFVPLFSVPLSAGRNFRAESTADRASVIINESAAAALGPGSPLGHRLSVRMPFSPRPVDLTVIGVCRDFHGQTLRSSIAPLVIAYHPVFQGSLAVKAAGTDLRAARGAIEEDWKEVFPDTPLRMAAMSDWTWDFYGSELQTASLGRIFTVLAVVLACLGLFGLVAQGTEQRRKEMGIRKVLGATPIQMIEIFFREFARPVVLSNAITWPLSFFLVETWLRGFVYQIPFPYGAFLLGAAGMLLIAWATVSGQVLRSASRNPVESLRYE